MTSSTLDNIQAQLEKTTGLILSREWLISCIAYLRQASEESADAVLRQVLDADLRDVVRPLNIHSTIEQSRVDSPHLLLRNSVRQSLRGETRKAILPSSFRLLVQVEELLDVSLDAEARFSKGHTNPSISNKKSRCLKVYLSDGHIPNFDLIGMEVSPVPNLSVNSTAGVKVLLRGPLEIRLGILQWTPSNVIVIGGFVADLVPIQRKALEQAQRLAGVDPTVRALIGSDPVVELEQQDEGENASSDVIARTGPQEHISLPRAVPELQDSELRTAQPPTEQTRQKLHIDQAPMQTSSIHEENKINQSVAVRGNPYARKARASTREAAPMDINTLDASKIVDLYDGENEPIDKSRQTEIPPSIETSLQQSVARANLPEPVSFEDLIALLRQHKTNGDEDKVYVVPAKMKDRHLYFNIGKKKKNKTRSENKRKSTGSSKEDKYEYVMNIHLTGSGTSQLVTSVVSDSVLRPHFQLKPGEMRKLSRENRPVSSNLVQKGGESVTKFLSVLKAWEVSILSPETISLPLDGKEPVLRIIQQSGAGT